MAEETLKTTAIESQPSVADEAQKIWDEIAHTEGKGALTVQHNENDAPNPDPSSTEQPASGKTAEELAAEKKAADIWANATPEQREEIEALRKTKETLEHENQSHRGRHSTFQRAYPELFEPNGGVKPRSADWKPPVRKPKDKQPSIVETEEFKQLETELPEVAKPMKAALTALTDQVNASQARLDKMDGERRTSALKANELVLNGKHSDWDPATQSQEFADWYAKQPAHRLAIINANADAIVDVDAASEALAWFKADTGWKAPAAKTEGDGKTTPKTDAAPSNKGSEADAKRALQLEGAAQPKTIGPVGAVSGIPKDGDPEQIWNQIREQEKADARRRTA